METQIIVCCFFFSHEDSVMYYKEYFAHFQEIPQSLWFLSVTLHQRRQMLLDLVKKEKEREKNRTITTVHGNNKNLGYYTKIFFLFPAEKLLKQKF